MKSKQLKLLCIVALCWFVGFSTAYAEDFKISDSAIIIMHFTDEAKAAIEADKGKENKVVFVEKSCSQDDFAAICQLDWIRRLEFDYNNEEVHDFSPLVNLKGLRKLRISSTIILTRNKQPFDLAPLAQLTGLLDIDFHATKVTNTQALSGLKNLRKASFDMSSVDSLDFLKGTPQLRELNLYGVEHKFKDYESLLGLKKLKILNIYMNKQATDELLAPLEALNSLTEIDLSNCSNVTTLSFLKNCKDLRKITAFGCSNLKDISALAQMEFLESVDISKSIVSDISALEDKAILSTLSISETSVSDISALSKCYNLENLYMVKIAVNDFSCLVNCDDLKYLGVSETEHQEQIDNLRSVFPGLGITNR